MTFITAKDICDLEWTLMISVTSGGPWTQWSACTASCGGGYSLRSKKCINGIIDQSESCPSSDAIETRICSMNSCGKCKGNWEVTVSLRLSGCFPNTDSIEWFWIFEIKKLEHGKNGTHGQYVRIVRNSVYANAREITVLVQLLKQSLVHVYLTPLQLIKCQVQRLLYHLNEYLNRQIFIPYSL